MIGKSGRSRRSVMIVSTPSCTGMSKSVITRSTLAARASSTPCWPSIAWMTLCPACPSALASTPRSKSSSSISRICAMRNFGLCSGQPDCGWRWFIDHCPERSELAHGGEETIEIDRLHDVAIGAEGVAFDHVCFFAGGSKNHDRQGAEIGVSANASQHLEPVDLRHLQVEE